MQSGSTQPSQHDLASHLETFLQWLESTGKGKETRKSYEYKLRAWLDWAGDRPGSTELVREYGRHLKARALRPRTRCVAQAALRHWFAWLKAQRFIRAVPDADALQVGRLDKPQRRTAQPGEVAALWAAATALPACTLRERFIRGRALVVLGLACQAGLRRAEIAGLDTGDITRTTRPWLLHVHTGAKGEETRLLPVSDDLQALLTSWLPLREAWCQEHGHTSPALLPVDRVRRLGFAGIAALFRDLCQRAGLKGLTPHAMRHHFAARIEEAAGVATTRDLLGHSSTRTTEAYLRTDTDRMAQAVNHLPPLVPPAPAPTSDSWRQVL